MTSSFPAPGTDVGTEIALLINVSASARSWKSSCFHRFVLWKLDNVQNMPYIALSTQIWKTDMVEIAEQTRRGRGRPQIRCDEETRQLLIEAARLEFLTNGYEGTCMTDVAQRAGVSTKTVYRLVPNKADLLQRVISDTIGTFMIDFDPRALDALPLSEAIERMLIAYGSLTLSEGTIAMHRLVIRECGQFPEVATAFYEAAILRTAEAMGNWLRRQCERGLITLQDTRLAAEMLRGMMIMDPQRAVMLGQRPEPDREEIVARARQCTQLFLNGCIVRTGQDVYS
jgi:AcrR family transcriptional regulator